MPSLVKPTTTVHRSFLAAIAEEQAAGVHDSSINLEHHAAFEERWEDPEGFADYVAALHADEHEDTPLPKGFVPATMLWWIDGDQFLGRIHVRHRLNDFLREVGGHIGYVVRPAARRRGHATAMLSAALPVAAGIGIDDALVTCDPGNVGSRRVIEVNGGRFVERRSGKLHFRIATS